VEGSKSSRMIDPQCPHIKSSPPVPDILLSVRRIERFSVVLGPTGSMSIVAISSPDMRQLRGHRFLENTARSTRLRPMSHFCLGRYVVQRPGNAKNGGLPRKPRFSTRESSSGRETDSPVEGDGFEPSVPGYGGTRRGWRAVTRPVSGTRSFVSTSSSERKPAGLIASRRRQHRPPRSTVRNTVFREPSSVATPIWTVIRRCEPKVVIQPWSISTSSPTSSW